MSRQTGPLIGFAIAVLVATVGCGAIDPKQAPVDAEAADFCKAYARLAKADVTTSSEDMKDYLQELARFGTPRGIPTAARNGFEYIVDPDHAFADGAAFHSLADQTDLAGTDAAALKVYVGQVC